ncbi:lipase family protein [Pseudonocardia sp. H11422]|uniref:lipase family protein n=1 Tax=Pseudonocardia sp. H11422 TaxID=2835866 RepID=UPI0027E32115|nr:lipase family protein [Pseudonocardia sp. H11422]
MSPRRSLRLTLIIAAGLALVFALAGTPAASAVPADDPQPGALLAADPSAALIAPLVPLPGRAWSLLYRSTSATGEPNVVSGTLLLPPGEWTGPGERPVVSYAVGTHGLGDQCAPSAQLASGTEQELVLVQQALARGWAVVVTDYEGLGIPGDHTYVVARAEGHAVLDAVRAAIAVPTAGLSAGAPVGIWGYSQGGGAAAVAAELAADYAPELDVRGVAAGGVPADLAAVFTSGARSPQATGLIVSATAGFDAAYPELALRELLTPAGQALYDDVRDECVGQIVAKGLPYTVQGLSAVPDPLAGEDVQVRLAENGAGSVAPAAPALVYHGGADELIPVTQARGLRADWCEQGATVQYTELPGAEHVDGAVLGGPAAANWLADRFADHPAPTSC